MLHLLADENFNNNIVRGVLRRKLDADIVLLIECSTENEWEGQIIYLPFK